MATFFGEVLPVRNRAYNDAEDEDEATDDFLNPFCIDKHTERALQAKYLIVAADQFATDYADDLLPGSCQAAATISRSAASPAEDDGDSLYYHRRPDPTTLHRLTEHVSLCRCSQQTDVNDANWLADMVLSQFTEPPAVVVLSAAPLAKYYDSGAISDEEPALIVRGLATREWKPPSPLKTLEPPNIVDGLSAAVVTRCRFGRVPCALVRLFTRSLRPDGDTRTAFGDAVRALLPADSVPPAAPQSAHRHRTAHDATEHIYM